MPRIARVVTMGFQGARGGSVAANREMVLTRLDRACREKPDLVCLPEEFTATGLFSSPDAAALAALSEPVPGPTIDAVARRARRHGTYIVCPLLRSHRGRYFNSAVLLDRRGGVAGIYDKVHPVLTRPGRTPVFEGGVTPGTAYPVFETDFGRLGLQICFDLDFIEGWRQLARQGAEMVVWASAYDGGRHLQTMAFLHHYFVVSAVATHHAAIVSPLGELLARGGAYNPLAIHDADMDFRVCHFDWHRERLKAIQARYGRRVAVRVLEEEGLFMIRSASSRLRLADVLTEFPLESYEHYHDRHRAAYARALGPRRRGGPA